MLLARFIVAPACCNQRPKELALLHHSEKLHFVLHYFASLNMLTFDLSAGNAWQPLKTLWASPGHYDHSANSMIDIKWVQLTQSITKPTVVFPWVYVDWLVMFNSPMMHETSNAWGFSILQTVHCYTYLLLFLLLLASLGLRKKPQVADVPKVEMHRMQKLPDVHVLADRVNSVCVCVWCVVNYTSVFIESRDISHHIQISPCLTCI